jgi:hypothetical protein
VTAPGASDTRGWAQNCMGPGVSSFSAPKLMNLVFRKLLGFFFCGNHTKADARQDTDGQTNITNDWSPVCARFRIPGRGVYDDSKDDNGSDKAEDCAINGRYLFSSVRLSRMLPGLRKSGESTNKGCSGLSCLGAASGRDWSFASPGARQGSSLIIFA